VNWKLYWTGLYLESVLPRNLAYKLLHVPVTYNLQ